MSAKPTRGPSRFQRLARLVLFTLCGLVGCGASLGVRAAFDSTNGPPEAVEHDAPDPPPPTDHLPPIRTRLETAVRSGDYPLGLKLIHELLAEQAHPDPDLTYREGICLEGLGRWGEALDAYRHLTAEDIPYPYQVAGVLSTVRCHLAVGNDETAAGLLGECERAVGGLPRVRAEVAFLRARLALSRVSKPPPGPFSPTAVAWGNAGVAAEQYLDWFPLPAWGTSGEVAPPPRQDVNPPAEGDSPEAGAERAVRTALAEAADHPGVSGLRLAAANLAFLDHRTGDAIREYRRLRGDTPHAPEALPASYNLGLALLRTWSIPDARKAFTEVIDRGRATPLGRLGGWWVGRLELDLGNPTAALQSWERSSGDRELTSAAGLGIALLHLLDDQPERAEKALRAVKAAATSPHGELAEAFACYFRYDRHPTPIRGDALAAAIRNARYGRPLGPAGEYLFGCWLRRVGKSDDAAAVHESGADQTRGPWGARMTLEVGDHLDLTGHTTAAKRRFAAVAATDTGPLGDRARLRLADLAARTGDGAECVRLCRAVLEADRGDRDEVLRLMGRGYELQGRPRTAAECFAGRAPTSDRHRDRP